MLAEHGALMSPEEYLRSELESAVKREYVAGTAYARDGATNQHNAVSGNVLAALHSRLRGTTGRAYNSDTKVRVRLPNGERFYYPDVQATCTPNPAQDFFQDRPTVVVEVLVDATRRIDEVEKREGYLSLPSLETYLLVESDTAVVVALQRTATGFEREVHAGIDAVVPLRSLGIELPLAEIYEGVALPPL